MALVGDIVIAMFPYTDLSGAKDRPSVVVANVGMGDWILCEITGSPRSRPGDIAIGPGDMQVGRLSPDSRVRPSRVHALNERVFGRYVGHLTDAKLAEILAAVRALF